jgi:hypothetical protein
MAEKARRNQQFQRAERELIRYNLSLSSGFLFYDKCPNLRNLQSLKSDSILF